MDLSVTVGIVNYNGMDVLPDTIRSVLSLLHPVREILVADNGSADESRKWLADNHPEIRCLDMGGNIGSAAARNALLKAAGTELVLLLDNDICLQPGALGRMAAIMESQPETGICHPEIIDEEDPNAYHYNGGSIHYLGALISRDKPEPGVQRPAAERFDVVAGGAILVRRETALAIGGFDEDYFFNWEDGDFSARMTLTGHYCVNAPSALALHRGRPRGVSKVFYQVRNRWFFMLKLYSWRTLILAFPMLFLFEILQALLLLKKRAFGGYLRGNFGVIKELPGLLAKRRMFQPMKMKRDRDWLRSGSMYVPASMGRGSLQRAGERVFYAICDAYWGLVRPLC